jgi:hypothetical protein
MSGRGPQSPAGRFALGLAGALLAFSLLVLAIDRLAPQPEGPDSSAYATAPAGLAAYADLLARNGGRVERRRRPVREGMPPARGTLVVLDPRAVELDEAGAIADWVRGGGRLVIGGRHGVEWLAGRLDEPLPSRADGEARSARVLAPAPETAGVRSVRAVAGGELRDVGGALPLLGPPGAPLAAVTRVGRGRVVVLADASPLQNRGLAREDNAAFALALATRGAPVTFLETVHGYGASTGLGALPASARWGLLGLLLAGLAFVWSRARRLGPPEDTERPLPPPRADYVDALAGSLARTGRPGEVARPLRAAAREGLARRAGLGTEPGDRELRAAAARMGLGEAETAALLQEPRDLEGALAAARALAAVNGTGAPAAGRVPAVVEAREAG